MKKILVAMNTFERVRSFLDEHKIYYRMVRHEPTFTSEESAKARGEDVPIGGKAIVMKVDDMFAIFVLSASLKVDSKKVKQYFKAKSIRFATKEELHSLTGLVPGSVPPFGKPLLDVDLFVDPSIERNEMIAFNAGSLTDSIIMKTSDYLAIGNAAQFDFSAI